MVIKNMSEELYAKFEPIRKIKIDDSITEALIIKPNSTISEVIGLLKKNGAYQAFIAYKSKIVSISIRDILEYKNIHTAKPTIVGKVIPTLNRQDTLAKASGLMSHYRVRALPVVEDGEIVGQVNSSSIIKYLESIDLNIKASSLMTPNVITISEDEKGSRARNLMIKHKIDHLPVVRDKKPVGILTSSHLMDILVPPEKPDMMTTKEKGSLRNLSFNVRGLADKEFVSVDVSDDIKHVVDIMSNNSSYTLVTLSDEIQGIITIRDLVSLMQERIRDEIPAYIIGLPEDPVEAELAKSKFAATLRLLKKVYSDILEARCKIKTKDITGERKRYEVDMHIITPKENITYVDTGWDLANVFDKVSNALKRRIEKESKRDRRSIRHSEEYREE